MENWQLETGERLASIERSIKYIEQNLSNLPPSPACILADEEMNKRVKVLEEFRGYILQRIAWVSGAFAVLSSGAVYLVDYIRDHISFN